MYISSKTYRLFSLLVAKGGYRLSESSEQIKYKLLSAKLVGSDIVCFRLEDETLLKVHVDLVRVGVAVDTKDPTGQPIYNITVQPRFEIVPKDKIFYAPKPPSVAPPSLGKDKRPVV
jgi:hypothetical protein